MAGDSKGPLETLKDLAKQAQDSVGSLTPPGGIPSASGSPLLQGLLAGFVVGKLRPRSVVGVLLGTVTGVYVAQTYQVPNIQSAVKDCLDKLKKGPGEE